MLKATPRRWLLFLLGLMPLAWLIGRGFTTGLGTDPAQTVVTFLGEWTLYFLFITLCVTPLRKLLKWNWLATHRRMLGLFSLFYAVLHVAGFTVFILGLDFARLGAELVERPYITVGLPAFLILVALGVTSTRGMMRRLGKNWVRLHRLVYLALFLSWVHVFWQVRASYFEAFVYGVIVVVLLGLRGFWWWRAARR